MKLHEVPMPPLTPENGPVLAYGTLLYDLDDLQQLDVSNPIVGSFRVEKIPSGDFHDPEFPPYDIREQWVGVDLPVRFPIKDNVVKSKLLKAGLVEFCDEDAVLSLLAAGRIAASKWFSQNVQNLIPAWFFGAHIGTLTLGSVIDQAPMTSLEYYGARLDPEVREYMENPDADSINY